MLKKITVITLTIFLGIGAFVSAQAKETDASLEVAATLFPTYDFARQIGKDKTHVTLLLPPGVESHAFEPRPSDAARISKSDIFIYTGEFMEPWAKDLLAGTSSEALLVVDASRGIELMADEDHDGEEEHHEEARHHGGKDPHIWTDLANAQKMVATITESFCEKDAENCAFYRANAASYNAKLADLDQRFKAGLADCKHHAIIYGGHFAFGYFAHRYGLEHVSPYRGFSPDAEPTPKAIAELIKTMRYSGMKYIYYEELLDPKVARTIAEETGAKLELLHGAHNVSKENLAKGITYLTIMEENLAKLRTGLECS
ncbi:MAG: zinc ABC transporter substrate-binding protein [Candidatus Omnitrophota bacterium]